MSAARRPIATSSPMSEKPVRVGMLNGLPILPFKPRFLTFRLNPLPALLIAMARC